jgi:hypothetical protein
MSTGFAALGEPISAKDIIHSNLSRVIVMFDPTRSNTIQQSQIAFQHISVSLQFQWTANKVVFAYFT